MSVREIVLRTMIEVYMTNSDSGTWPAALGAHALLSGKTIKEAHNDLSDENRLAQLYPELVRSPTVTEIEWSVLVYGKVLAKCIYHDDDLRAYYNATEKDREAWNEYVEQSARIFNASPELDSYDSTSTVTGVNRDGKVTPWCPPTYFPEWLVTRTKTSTP